MINKESYAGKIRSLQNWGVLLGSCCLAHPNFESRHSSLSLTWSLEVEWGPAPSRPVPFFVHTSHRFPPFPSLLYISHFKSLPPSRHSFQTALFQFSRTFLPFPLPFFSSKSIWFLLLVLGAMTATASRGRAELHLPKKWKERETSPERTKVWTEPNRRRVSVVYYLSRNGQLEHPHFIEVPLSSSDGLFLRGNDYS